jgi:uncharacterized protein (TIGR02996 family)
MTDTASALLRAIAAHPREDTPRLVYADCLDELGEPAATARAEFIRLQVRAAQFPQSAPERAPLVRRMGQLLCAWDGTWRQEMPAGFTALSGYARGFAHRAAARASALLHAPDDPRVLFIEHLELEPDVGLVGLRTVVHLPLFAQLTDLVVRHGPLTWRGTRALASGSFPRLERLVLALQAIGDAGLQALIVADGFPRLRVLDVSQNDITTAGLTDFRSSPLYRRLQHVSEWGNGRPRG